MSIIFITVLLMTSSSSLKLSVRYLPTLNPKALPVPKSSSSRIEDTCDYKIVVPVSIDFEIPPLAVM